MAAARKLNCVDLALSLWTVEDALKEKNSDVHETGRITYRLCGCKHDATKRVILQKRGFATRNREFGLISGWREIWHQHTLFN